MNMTQHVFRGIYTLTVYIDMLQVRGLSSGSFATCNTCYLSNIDSYNAKIEATSNVSAHFSARISLDAISAWASGSCSGPVSAHAAMFSCAPGNQTQLSGLPSALNLSMRFGALQNLNPTVRRKAVQNSSGHLTEALCSFSQPTRVFVMCASWIAIANELRKVEVGMGLARASNSGLAAMNRATFVHAAVCNVGNQSGWGPRVRVSHDWKAKAHTTRCAEKGMLGDRSSFEMRPHACTQLCAYDNYRMQRWNSMGCCDK
jgi:hypothetical protein